jgi:ectoine hydroxylase-related dioxygenase (phytanoyl-CoA dioxygenase family)
MNVHSNGVSATTIAIDEWVETFHRDGYLVLHDVLPLDLVAQLKQDLDDALAEHADQKNDLLELRVRMFEISTANLGLFDREPIVSFAEALVAPDCHVVHNNSFRTVTGAGIATWHQDDAPHLLVTHGEPPTNIRLPVLLFTANYYLTDVDAVEHGPTEVIPGSHLFGSSPPPDVHGSQ